MTKQFKKIFLVGLSALFCFCFLTVSFVKADEVSGSLNTGLDTGLNVVTENCNPLAVANGTVAPYPACTITCNPGYTPSGITCVSSGGGGGGGGAAVSPPQISNIQVTVTSSTATITWTTDKAANSKVNYGLTTAYGLTVSSSALVTSHSLILTGLTPSTTYHYQVQSTDGGVTGSYSDKTFTTLAGAVTPITGQATITASTGGTATATSAEGSTAKAAFPAGSVSADVQLVITPVGSAASLVGSPPAGSFMVGGHVYTFSATSGGVAITTFTQPVALTFTYTDAQIAGLDESTLTVYRWDTTTSTWVALTTTVNAATNTVTTTTTQFSYFALMGQKVTVPVEKPISEMSIAELQAKITEILALITQLQAEIARLQGGAAIVGIPTDFKFTATLKIGDVSTDVKYLQIVLNSDSDTRLAPSGVGSSGYETNIFGSLTQAAVIKFQEKYASDVLAPWGFTKGTGIVGSTTRAKLNAILGR